MNLKVVLGLKKDPPPEKSSEAPASPYWGWYGILRHITAFYKVLFLASFSICSALRRTLAKAQLFYFISWTVGNCSRKLQL